MKAPAVLASLLLAAQLHAADPAAAQEAQVAAVIKEIQTQQAQMADNQAKIEEKLAAVVEAVRVARIYSSRGGR
ncbi:MAG: hypothetical protein M3R10_03645 [Verrucomicrobiota bacterium]|nr:hypothetical protein [Verrucomicrobiota bacterium]